jgi:hypothetical protein
VTRKSCAVDESDECEPVELRALFLITRAIKQTIHCIISYYLHLYPIFSTLPNEADEAARLRTGQATKESLPKISSRILLRDVGRAGLTTATYEMPRQRSKKLSASRKTVQQPVSEQPHVSELERERDQSESENDSLDILEKDSDEEELDRLVLGDQGEFSAQLGNDMDLNQAEGFEESGAGEEDGDEEGGLENVDDADVRDSTTLS